MQPSNASTSALAGAQLTPVQAAIDGTLVDLPRGPRPAVITSHA